MFILLHVGSSSFLQPVKSCWNLLMLLMVCNYKVWVNALRVKQTWILLDIWHQMCTVTLKWYCSICDWGHCGTAKVTFFCWIVQYCRTRWDDTLPSSFKNPNGQFHHKLYGSVPVTVSMTLASSEFFLFYLENCEFVIVIWILHLLP